MVKVLLIVVQGKPEGKTIPITGDVFRVGRGLDCHLRPNSEEVSREHAEITLSETEAVVRDLGSRNGTWVNGQLLKGPHKLSSGELLKIGPLTFAVAIQGLPEGQPVAAGAGGPSPAAATRRASLDDVPPDQIDAWLVSDQSKPTPDRPSGVYDGETLTLEAYRSGKPGSSGSVPAKAKVEPPAPVVPNFEAQLEGIEMLPEGAGDAVDEGDQETGEEGEGGAAGGGTGSGEQEMMDESNPFYAAKKAAEDAKGGEPEKVQYKDSSDAASDILRKMLDRRRAPR